MNKFRFRIKILLCFRKLPVMIKVNRAPPRLRNANESFCKFCKFLSVLLCI